MHESGPRRIVFLSLSLVTAAGLMSLSPLMAQDAPPGAPTSQPVSASPVATQPAPPAAPAKIDDFAWLAGRWVGQLQNGRTEEIWSKPDGGVMMGMFRMISADGKTLVIEQMTLRQSGDTVEMHLRHMDEKLTTWEPIDQAGVMRLAGKSADEYVFVDPAPNLEKPKRGQPLRQIWRVRGDTLRFEVFAARNGEEKKIVDGEQKRAPL